MDKDEEITDVLESDISKKTAIDEKGSEVLRFTIAFDEESYKKGYPYPWEAILNGVITRDSLIQDIETWLDRDNPYVKEDPKLRDRIIEWCCERLKLPTQAFYNKKNLEQSVDNMANSLEELRDAQHILAPSPELQVRNIVSEFQDIEEKEEFSNAKN